MCVSNSLNMDIQGKSFHTIELSKTEFEKLSKYIFENYGIKMPFAKKIMLQSRLQKRLRHLNMDNFKQYIDYVFGENGSNEMIHMMDVVSTNKTDFFREPTHFEFLQEVVLPHYKASNTNNIKVWSAGSSSGEEAYTIAMVLEEFKKEFASFNYHIYGSDISTDMLKKAVNAVYKMEKIIGIPEKYKKKYLLRSKDPAKQLVRIAPVLRTKVNFFRLNFMETYYNVQQTFDIIFCRNTLIYFERDTQEAVINRLCNHLKPGGYFILGHSESITNMNVPLQSVKPTIFQKRY